METSATSSVFCLAAHVLSQAVYRLWFHPLSKFPGPAYMALTPLPMHFSDYIRGTWVRQVARLHRKYGPAVRIGPDSVSFDGSIGWNAVYGHRPGSGTKSAEFPKPPSVFPEGEQSLITAGRPNHRRQRRQLAHGFSDGALAQQEPILVRYVDLLLRCLSERVPDQADGGVVDIVSWLNVTTMDIIGHLSFSQPFSCLAKDGYREPWMHSISHGIQGVGLRRFSHEHPVLGCFLKAWGLSSAARALDVVRTASRQKAATRIDDGPPEDHDLGTGQHDFIAYMMRRTRDGGDGMPRRELLANAPTLVIAGSETTASALSGFCFYLSKNEAAYAALAHEIRSAYASEDEIDLRNTASLEYLQATIHEVLRMYPPAAQTQYRLCTGDVIDGVYVPEGIELNNNNVKKKKARLHVYQYATFRNPDNFTDPDSFIPERWLPPTHALYDARFARDRRSVFKPFSHGPRDCIGKNLAQSEMRLIISKLLYRFDFSLATPQDDWHESQRVLTLWTKGPLYVRLRRRLSGGEA
ncbi:hypothetical protein L249_4632 [Ophiocordyceps polyrhachis-furcata BCC 54312]|uniref:Cytochrome P450 n=1 Tax=Ophiocordyceps polyrhachis-furcata BCC 54312 TaxID=1330021 RepID=A0A367L3Q9_9HYPO|nr:hypothetical protein L249_4632 [Ophiocordyceps polyrhachis-furcata BCC 54312]